MKTWEMESNQNTYVYNAKLRIDDKVSVMSSKYALNSRQSPPRFPNYNITYRYNAEEEIHL